MPEHVELDRLLAECEAKLAVVEAAHVREMSKPVGQRRPTVLLFFDRERSVYSYGAWLLRRVRNSLIEAETKQNAR